MTLSKRQWNILIVSGQILFFLGSIIFSGYALDTQKEIRSYQDKLEQHGCTAPEPGPQSFEMNTSTQDSSFKSSSFTTDRGT